MVTLEEAKAYLRVDSDYEDGLISSLLASSGKLCADVACVSVWSVLSAKVSGKSRLFILTALMTVPRTCCETMKHVMKTFIASIMRSLFYL